MKVCVIVRHVCVTLSRPGGFHDKKVNSVTGQDLFGGIRYNTYPTLIFSSETKAQDTAIYTCDPVQ